MATIGKFTITGIAQWAKVFPNNKDMGFKGAWEPYEGMYVIDLVINEKNLETYRASQAAGKAKEAYYNEEGGFYTDKRKNTDGSKNVLPDDDMYIVKFKRKHIDPVSEKLGGQPVIMMNGKATDIESIGNGSIVEVIFETYTTSQSNGARMEVVNVLELVKFERPENPAADEPANKNNDDEIPF